jgi:hypothetical protein
MKQDSNYLLNTKEFAAMNLVKAGSVRVALCKQGHYLNVVPKKLANGRLAWPSLQVEVSK